MITKLTGGRVILQDEVRNDISIYFEDGTITAVTSDDLPFDTLIDADGAYIAPGFVDIHTHGAADCDFCDGTAEAFLTAAEMQARHGATTVIPTATSGDTATTLKTTQALSEAQSRNALGADMPGLHFEGPYFAYSQRGAQDPRHLRDPRPEDYMPILDMSPSLMRWSIAPELPGAFDLARECVRRGIVVAIGHSDAEYEQAEAAFEAGFTHVTHLYSSMSTVHRRDLYRHGGVVEAAYLNDDMTVEIIADGKHLPKELLQLVYKIKGAKNIALITDSMRGAGMPDGKTMLGNKDNGLPCIIDDGVAKLPDLSAFAGSVATFDRLVRNMVYLAGIPMPEVIQMASTTPARIMGLKDRGALFAGLRADIVIFNDEIEMQTVIVKGKTIYRRNNP